ncbi:hypothetical protein LTR85_008881 [Meristemomyces frigidus]|nr:hypothetical protein LTR85_008881 [Meristemomyces frigidus]
MALVSFILSRRQSLKVLELQDCIFSLQGNDMKDEGGLEKSMHRATGFSGLTVDTSTMEAWAKVNHGHGDQEEAEEEEDEETDEEAAGAAEAVAA